MQQPVILRNLRSTRVRTSRPPLEDVAQSNVWRAMVVSIGAMPLVEALGTPRRRTPLERFSTPGFRNRPDQVYRFTDNAGPAERNQVIRAVYRQVVEREQPEGSTLNEEESRLRNAQITVRDFIRALVRSEIWRRSFFNPWPNTKVVEFLYKQLLGRPPSDQKEIISVHGVLSRQGLGAAADVLIDSDEYRKLFGEDVVPYPRYKSSPQLGYTARSFAGSVALQPLQTFQTKRLLFPSYGGQSVSFLRTTNPQTRPIKIYSKGDAGITTPVLVQAVYRQLLERVPSWDLKEFSAWESQLKNDEIMVRQFVRLVGQSELYRKLYYAPYPNSKVVEFNLKHFLGRAPSSAAEVAYHHDILAQQGIRAHIDTLVNSDEYIRFFGESTVPYATLQSERYVTVTDQPSNAYRGTRVQASQTFYADRKGIYGALMTR